ncbi:hypothetical protein L3Q82_005745 [Scortum barcoo]|uniref:Uncharacterized protein n=1 Tax=Scortum barcoo TaxID=214431 RepID=A0ACB8V8H4_9TELE|nr:hypothetical protein L3Q82_005745 [Scortum barcoo]
MDPSSTGTMQRIQSEKSILDEPDSPLEVSYTVPEEMAKGSLVGNIAQDLGLDVKRLKSGKARIYTGDSVQYIELSRERGVLLIKEKIDREALCRQTTPCALHFQVTLENPLELFPITVEITDINDNAPVFQKEERRFEISESAVIGSKFMLEKAIDPDIGQNGLQRYTLKPSDNFVLKLHTQSDGSKKVEMILQKPLDREKQEHISLVLTAEDGGEPQMTGTMQIHVTVLDANDNAPVFSKPVYKASITENSVKGTLVTKVSASDADKGTNGEVTYVIGNSVDTISKLFHINAEGEVILHGPIDYEIEKNYHIDIEAIDLGGLSDSMTCSDEGVPSLSSSVTLTLQISDVNDNAPVFERSSYEAYVVENNTPGLSIFTVKARDADWNQNARVSYILEDSSVNGVPVSSYVSVSADSGVIHAVRSFDYEQIKDFQFHVKAQDGGSPPLSSNVTVKIMIQDQNDNPPQVLYPVQTGGSLVAEMVPRSADVGYLVTKVVAVDVDSGQNAWLSYKLQKATDRALFEVGSQNGEIRTIRQVTDKDAVKQRLTVIVEDNGQPSRSATVIVNVAVADSFPEVLSEFTDFTHDKEYNDNLTFYLVLALAVVSFLFITCLVVIISVKIYSAALGQVSYSIPEEMAKGSLVGNIAQDLGLDVKRLQAGRARIHTGDSAEYIQLNKEKGLLIIKERIDREALCGQTTPCALHFQIALENPIEIFPITVEITDINDNAPVFEKEERRFEISESAVIGSKFMLEKAIDPDIGLNGLQSYTLKPNDHFILKLHGQSDGGKKVEMILQKPLDRERQEFASLLLTVVDGGEPRRSGTMQIHITVLDANDNAPVFTQDIYKASVKENSPTGTLITKVSASDADKGSNGEDSSVNGVPVSSYVSVSADSGVIHAVRSFDYEQIKDFQFHVKAQDGGSPPLSSNVDCENNDPGPER